MPFKHPMPDCLRLRINGETISAYLMKQEGSNAPLIIINGGPGGTFTNSFPFLSPLSELTDRPLLFYDQVGGALSKPEEEKDPSFWRLETWMDELMAIVDHFGFGEVILLGHSFGGMLAMAAAIERSPKWLKGLILSSTLCSSLMWEEDAKAILATLPKKVRNILIEGASKGDFLTTEYKKAEAVYFRKCVNPKYRYNARKSAFNPAYFYGWGPSEFAPTGTLKDFDYSARLNEISVPTLILSGAYDESSPRANEFMFEQLVCPKDKVLFPNSHHRSYDEENEAYLKAVSNFLSKWGL